MTDKAFALPDGSGFMTGSFPLPKEHWLYQPNDYSNVDESTLGVIPRSYLDENQSAIDEAIKTAIRGTTMSGKEMDFDPDAMLQNIKYHLFGSYLNCDIQEKS